MSSRQLQRLGFWTAVLVALVLLWAGAGQALADTDAVVAEAEKGGVDLLYAALAALVAGGGGLFLKRPQDMVRERRAQAGAQAVSGGNGRVDAGHRALDELAEHERQCQSRMRAVYARIEKVEERLARLEEKVGRAAEDIAYIRGILTPTGG